MPCCKSRKRKGKGKEKNEPMELAALKQALKEDEADDTSNLNRLAPEECPEDVDPENWSGLEDYRGAYAKNNVGINLFSVIAGIAIILQGVGIYDELWKQADFYAYFDKAFQHIKEIKLTYTFIRDNTNDIGVNPGHLAGGLMIFTSIIGTVELIIGRCGYPYLPLTRAVWISAYTSCMLAFPVYANSLGAMWHYSYVENAWFGIGPNRNRTGFCHMDAVLPPNKWNKYMLGGLYTEYNITDMRYILPVEMRECDWIWHIHGLQFTFGLYIQMIGSTHMRLMHRPAWAGWTKEKYLKHCKRSW
jgi:hypothetical protein